MEILTTSFSGCDTYCFFDKKNMATTMYAKFTKNSMKAIFTLESGMEKFLYNDKFIKFDFISINQLGIKGYIGGYGRIKDFEITLSVDELCIEAVVEFEQVKIDKIIGHMNDSKIKSLIDSLRGINEQL